MRLGKLGTLLGRGKTLTAPSSQPPEPAVEQRPAQPEPAAERLQPPATESTIAEPEPTTPVPPLPDVELETHTLPTEIQDPNMDDDDRLIIVNLTEAQAANCEQRLVELTRTCPGAYGAIISTIDGHNVLHSLKRDIPFNKISTMNSSLLALGESIARESEQRFCQFVILENSNGRVVSLRINDVLMLTCISTKDSNLGMLLSAGRNTADALNEILR